MIFLLASSSASLYIAKERLSLVMTVFTLVMLAFVSVLCNFFSLLLLKTAAFRAVRTELSYSSAYYINYSVTYLYITAYHFLGPLIYVTAVQSIGLNIHIAFVISIALSAIAPFLVSSLVYAAFIYEPDSDRKIGLLKGLHIAGLVAVVIIPILLVIAFAHSFIPAN